jgi:phage-related protein
MCIRDRNSITQALKDIWNVIVGVITQKWNELTTFLNFAFVSLKGIWDGFWTSVNETITNIWNSIVKIIQDKWNEFTSFITSGVTNVTTEFNKLKDNIIGAITSIDLFQAGKDVVQGLINGIQSMAGNVSSAISSMTSNLSKTTDNELKINSPSKIFEWKGQMIGKGLENGINTVLDNLISNNSIANKIQIASSIPLNTTSRTNTNSTVNNVKNISTVNNNYLTNQSFDRFNFNKKLNAI